MQTNTRSGALGPMGVYESYSHESEPYLSCRSVAQHTDQTQPFQPDVASTFSPPPPLGRRLGHPQTVEQIIDHGYLAMPISAPEAAIVSDKKHTSWLAMDDLISRVRRRYEIYNKNMYELDVSICEASNALFRQEAAQGCPADQRQWYSTNKRVQDLYEQQRAERVNLWRDVTRVRESLPEVAQQYLASYRKLSILADAWGDSP